MPTPIIPSLIQLEGTGHTLQRITPSCAGPMMELIDRAKDDDLVAKEFPETIRDYSRSLDDVMFHLKHRYASYPFRSFGYLAVNDQNNRIVGMTSMGLGEGLRVYTPAAEVISVNAVCFSYWLLKEARGLGVMRAACEHLTTIGNELKVSSHPETRNWNDRPFYTEVREGNVSSEHIVEHLGLEPEGISIDDSAYRSWINPQDWQKVRNDPANAGQVLARS